MNNQIANITAELGMYTKDRQILHDILPLDTPLLIDFHISNICIFHCNYCINSAPKGVYDKTGLRREFMSWETFELAVKQIKEFPQKIKQISLDGIGEPLLNPMLPDMIRLLRQEDVANNVIVISNAAKLTPELGEKLVDAGLQTLRISLQGLTEKKYMEISRAKIDWDEFYQNIVHFSKIKKNCELRVKIADTALDPGDEERFYSLFGNMCDAVAIEHIYDAFGNIGKVYDIPLVSTETNKYGFPLRNIQACWYPFIRMDMRSDGVFANCCNTIFGFEKNIRDVPMIEQWNGEAMNRMRVALLKHDRSKYIHCQRCHIPNEEYHPEDVLDGYEDDILARMREKGMLTFME